MDCPVFMINLNRDQDKLKSAGDRLKDVGIFDFERVEAVNGSALSDEEITNNTTRWCNTYCTKSTIGCFLSHRNVWAAIVDRNLSYAMVLEDDVAFKQGGIELIRLAMEELPDDWDVCFCGCFTCEKELAVERMIGWFRGMPLARPYSKHLRIPGQTYGTQSLLISQKGAQKMLALLPKASGHLDWELAVQLKLGHLKVFATQPNATFQTGMGASSIASHAPVLLNSVLAHVPVGPEDERPMSWLLSAPLFAINRVPITGWVFLFVLSGYAVPRSSLTFLMIDSLVSQHPNHGAYISLFVASIAGSLLAWK